MEKCKKCNTDFTPSQGLVSYCSLQCRNSRKWSEQDRKKKSMAAKASTKVQAHAKKLKIDNTGSRYYRHLSDEEYVLMKKNRKEKVDQDILSAEYASLKFERLRRRVILEQKEKCNKCGINEWMGETLSFELDHKDGDNRNNIRENLEALCPNCHSLTPTWRGKNKQHRRKEDRVDDKALLDALLVSDGNTRQALLSVGMAAKGGNYNRCHKLLKEMNDVRQSPS